MLARAIVIICVLLLTVSAALIYILGVHERAPQAKTAPTYDLSTAEGYAEAKLKSGLDLVSDDDLQVMVRGKVTNTGDRALKDVQAKLKYEDPRRKGREHIKYYRLGSFNPGESRDFGYPVFKLDRDKAKPYPSDPKLVIFDKPVYELSISRVRFGVVSKNTKRR